MRLYFISISFIFFILPFNISAQNSVAALSSSLYDIDWWDENNAVTIGGNSILTTQNQGVSWTRHNVNRYNYAQSIREVEIVNDQTAVVIGSDGALILRTTDRGNTWASVPSITGNENFFDIQFIDGIGYLVGRYRYDNSSLFTPVLYKSLDDGASWQQIPSNISIFSTFNPSFHIYFRTALLGYLSGPSGIFITNDGGITWIADTNAPTNLNVDTMQFTDANKGYGFAISNGIVMVHETLDGGTTWSPLNFTENSTEFQVFGDKIYYGNYAFPSYGINVASLDGSNQLLSTIDQHAQISDIEFLDEMNGYAIGKHPYSLSSWGRFIYKTNDGGITWNPIDNSSHMEGNGNHLTFIKKVTNEIYVRSDINLTPGNTNSHIVHSFDNGASWQVTSTYNIGGEITYAEDSTICFVRYFDPNNSGNGVISAISTDNGQTWVEGPVSTHFASLSFSFWQQVSINDIFWDTGAAIYNSSDNGQTWSTQAVPTGIGPSFKTQFISPDQGYLYTTNATTGIPEIYITTDGAQSWTLLFDIPSHTFSYSNDNFDFTDPNRLIVIPAYPSGSAFLYDTNTSALTEASIPDFINYVKSVNSQSFLLMTNTNGAHYTEDNGANFTQLTFTVESSTSAPPSIIEPDGAMTFYGYNSINRIKKLVPDIPDFLVGPELTNLATTTNYILPVDPFSETEWELLSGGNLILDPDLEYFRASVQWTTPGVHTLRARRTTNFGSSPYVEIQVEVNNVIDNTPPVVITQNITRSVDANGNVTIEAIEVNNGSSDNFTPSNLLIFTLDKYSFSCEDIGDNEVILTVTDLSGNSASGTAMVTIEDVLSPVTITQNITIDLAGNSSISITPEDIDNGSFDNCEVSNLSLDTSIFTAIGVYVVELTAADAFGNLSSETAEVTVIDSVLGINDSNIEVLKIYPNPTNDQLFIQSSEIFKKLVVYDINGKVLAIYDHQLQIDFTSFKIGIYLIEFEMITGESIYKRVVKE